MSSVEDEKPKGRSEDGSSKAYGAASERFIKQKPSTSGGESIGDGAPTNSGADVVPPPALNDQPRVEDEAEESIGAGPMGVPPAPKLEGRSMVVENAKESIDPGDMDVQGPPPLDVQPVVNEGAGERQASSPAPAGGQKTQTPAKKTRQGRETEIDDNLFNVSVQVPASKWRQFRGQLKRENLDTGLARSAREVLSDEILKLPKTLDKIEKKLLNSGSNFGKRKGEEGWEATSKKTVAVDIRANERLDEIVLMAFEDTEKDWKITKTALVAAVISDFLAESQKQQPVTS